MKISRFSIIWAAVAGFMSVAFGPCSTSSITCPSGTSDNGDSTCVSDATLSEALDIADPLGTELPDSYYLGNNVGFVLGNGALFSRTASSDTSFIPDVTASFGKGPIPSAGLVTENFLDVAVYSSTQAENASGNGYTTYDPVEGVTSDLTGYIVAVGYALTSEGAVTPLIARFTPRGTLDTTFGGGKGYIVGTTGDPAASFSSGSFAVLGSVAIDSQGRIVVGGYGNSQPSFPYYLSFLETSTDGDPITLFRSTLVREELTAILARYLPNGTIDSSGFDTTDLEYPASGSAVHGLASSPSTGFIGTATVGTRYDVVFDVAVDSDDGIFAVGATAISADPNVSTEPAAIYSFIQHYDSGGELLSGQVGKTQPGLAVFNATAQPHEYFTSVAIDSDGNAVAAGMAGTISSVGAVGTAGVPPVTPTFTFATLPLVARFSLTDSGTGNEAIALDTDFSAGAGSDGYEVLATITGATRDYVKSLVIDEDEDVYLLSGHGVSAAGDTLAFVSRVNDSTAAVTSYLSPGPGAGFAGGNGGVGTDGFHGVAKLVSGSTTRYLGAGYSIGNSTEDVMTRGLVASMTTSLVLDTAGFDSSPYSAADPALTILNALFPFALNWAPNALSFYGSPAGTQVGPLAAVYGGGNSEKFNAIAPSADGAHAIVVGYSTKATSSASTVAAATLVGGTSITVASGTGVYFGNSGTVLIGERGDGATFEAFTFASRTGDQLIAAPAGDTLTKAHAIGEPIALKPAVGRAYPILLMYNIDGTFVDLGSFDDFEAMQDAL